MKNSVNTRIAPELNEIVEKTIHRLSPLSKKITGKELSYPQATKLLALKLKKYTIPITKDIINEMNKILKENGGER